MEGHLLYSTTQHAKNAFVYFGIITVCGDLNAAFYLVMI